MPQLIFVQVGKDVLVQAPGIQQARQRVPPCGTEGRPRRLRLKVLIHKISKQADNISKMVVNRYFARHNVVALSTDNAGTEAVIGDHALMDHVPFHVAVVVRVDVPAHVLVGFAQDIGQGMEAVKIQEALARAPEAPVPVLPKKFDGKILHSAEPQRLRGQLLRKGVGPLRLQQLPNLRLRIPDQQIVDVLPNPDQGVAFPKITAMVGPGAQVHGEGPCAGVLNPL